MLPAPSFDEMKRTLEWKRTPVIGLLFAPAFSTLAVEAVIPRLGYLDQRAGDFIHFFCAGYGAYHFAEDTESIGNMTYKDGTVIPWGFSQRKFASFVDEIQRATTWQYSGDVDLILTKPDLTFTDCVLYDVASMMRDGALDSMPRLFEAVISYTEKAGGRASVTGASDQSGIAILGEAAAEGILNLMPKPLQGLWKKGLHYRTRDLSRPRQ